MARWNHVALPAVMVLMGVLLITSSLLTGFFGTVLFPMDQQFGTRGTIAGVAFGIGVTAAAVNPTGHVSWVRAAILYCALDAVYEILLWIWLGGQAFSLVSLIVAIIFGALLIFLYPNRSALVPSSGARTMGTAGGAAR
jgi:hypothetical protein